MSPIFVLSVAFVMGACVGSVFMAVFVASKAQKKIKHLCLRFAKWLMENNYHTYGDCDEWKNIEGPRLYSLKELYLLFMKEIKFSTNKN
jgi:hypothetical protein